MSTPKVWYTPKKTKAAENLWDTWGADRRRREEETASKAKANTESQYNSLKMKAAESQARHDVPITNDDLQKRAQASGGLRFLSESNVSDDEIRDNLGLTPDIDVTMFRANPTLYLAKDADLQTRIEDWSARRGAQQDEERDQEQIWIKDAWGFIKSGLDKAGISTVISVAGKGLELAEQYGMDIPNEKLTKLFPEDATGVRKWIGQSIGTGAVSVPGVVGSPSEGGMPRLLTFKQIQGVIQDGMNELPIGTDEERARYLARIDELKAEGVTDDEARIQAFNEREDIPEWFKFVLPIISDPTTFTGGVGFLRGAVKTGVKAQRGIRSGARAKGTARIVDQEEVAEAIVPRFEKSIEEIADGVAAEHTGIRGSLGRLKVGERVANIPGVGKVANKLPSVDPSGALRRMTKGTPMHTLLSGKIGYNHMVDAGAKNAEYLTAVAKGNFGKLEDMWGVEVLGPGKMVSVKVRPSRDMPAIGIGGRIDDISVPLADVMSNPSGYYLNSQQNRFAKWFGDVYNDFAKQAVDEGLDINIIGDFNAALYFSARKVKGKIAPDGGLEPLAGYDNYIRRAGIAGFQKSRVYESMLAGVNDGYEYFDVYETLGVYASTFYKQVALKRLDKAVSSFTRSTSPREAFGDLYDAQKSAKKLMNQQTNFAKEVQRFLHTEGQFVNKKTVNNIKKSFAPVADDSDYIKDIKNGILKDVDDVLSVRQDNWNMALKTLKDVSFELPKGVTYQALKEALVKGRIITGSASRKHTIEELLEAGGEIQIKDVRFGKGDKFLTEQQAKSRAEDLRIGISEGDPTSSYQVMRRAGNETNYRNILMGLRNQVSEGGRIVDDILLDSIDEAANVRASSANKADVLKELNAELAIQESRIKKIADEALALEGDADLAKADAIQRGIDKIGEFTEEVADAAGPGIYKNVGAKELKEALSSINLRGKDNSRIAQALTKEIGKQIRQTRRKELEALVENMNKITPGSKVAFQRIKDDITSKAQTVTRPQVIDGVAEKPSRLLGDRIYTGSKEVVEAGEELDEFILGQTWLKPLQDMNSALRYFKTTFDLGTPLIQGLPVLFRDPEAWGKATAMMVKTLKDPAVRARYVADNATDINRYLNHGMHIGSTEATQALQTGGWLAKLPTYATSRPNDIAAEGVRANASRLGAKGLKPLAITAQRAGAAYDIFLDVSRVEMMKGLESLAGKTGKGRTGGITSFTYDKDMAELAQFVNKTTGVTSSRAMGVGVTQQALEGSLLLFSPQYTRATAALFMDITSGGLRGDQARKAIASLFAGQVMLHAAITTATGQEMNLVPGQANFLKVQFGDTLVGFGSKSNSLVNMAADVAEQLKDNPQGLMNWKVWDNNTFRENSFLKRLRYQSSPLAGQALSWITGTDAIGRSLPDKADIMQNPIKELGQYAGSQLLPIWMEAAYENGDFKGASGVYEMFGASARDVEHRTTRRELQEKYFEEDTDPMVTRLRDEGFTWKEFEKHPRYRTMYNAMQQRHPDLVEVEDKLKEVAKDFAWGEERMAYDDRVTQARTEQINGTFSPDGTLTTPGLEQAALEFQFKTHGARSGEEFRKKVGLAAASYHTAKGEIRKQFPNLIKQNEEYYRGTSFENKVNAVTSEYFDFLQSPLSKDTFGNMNYQALDSFMRVAEQNYSKDVMDEVVLLKEERLLETPEGVKLPQIVIAYYKAQTQLRPYWETWKEALSPDEQAEYRAFVSADAGQKEMLRAGNSSLVRMEERVKRAQDRLRRTDYTIDKHLMNFYDYAPMNRQLASETRIKATSIRRGN